jgi:hypothetical protein
VTDSHIAPATGDYRIDAVPAVLESQVVQTPRGATIRVRAAGGATGKLNRFVQLR